MHTVRVRFRADFYSGSINAPSTTFDDTGWATVGTVTPPTSTGLSCYYTWWNRTVPSLAQYGPATVSAQLTIENYGKGAISDTAKFYVAPYGNKTQQAPPPAEMTVQEAGPAAESDEGPFLAPAAAP